MAPPPKHLLFFGDNAVESLSAIQALVRNSKTNQAARRFLQEATDIVQLEFSRLNQQEHGWDKGFDSLLGLAEDYERSNSVNLLVSIVLICVGRLGHLIVYADEDPTILGSPEEPVEILALCGGLLPGAVAMAAKDTSELFSLSRMLLSILFRLGVEIRRRIELVEDSPKTWGKTYTGLPSCKVQDILNQFHESQGLPEFRKIAIGVLADDWLTLIGPPSSLARLDSWSSDIRNASSLETKVAGPMHSPWVPRINLAKVLGNSPLLEHPIDLSKARMISPASCAEYKHLTLGPLLGQAIVDIVHDVLRVSESIQRSVSSLDANRKLKLTVIGPTNHLAAIRQALKIRGIEFRINQHSTATGNESSRGGSDLVAIVGMSGRFPGSETAEGFWEDLVAGKCHIKEVPKDRFDLEAAFDASGEKKNSTTARHGAWLSDPGLFDHRLFNVSPREAAQMDPSQRLLQTITYEALQSAGYSPDGSLATGRSRIATYFGQAAEEWREILNQQGADIYYVPGLSRAFSAGRLNYHYKWGGSSLALDSACSSSATAVSLACAALAARECDTAVAGGVSVLTSPNTFSGLSKAGMLSTTDGCRTYHDDADGYARAEGAGVVVLKRLEDAVSDNDNVLAVIRGSARTYSSTATSITHPSATSQQEIYNQVLRQSCLDPDEIAYVEMHGTGTQAGDFEEMTSVVNALARRRLRDNPLTVGAVKAAMGHGEGAAGITSLIKVIMMLRERQIPPQPGWPFKLNSKFPPLAEAHVKISTKLSPLRASPKGDKKIKMIVNSFDASGGNVSLVVEEAPSRIAKSADPRAWHTVAISARTPVSVQNNRARLLDFLERHPETSLADLAYTTTARRIHEPLRCTYTGNSTRDIIRQLRDDVHKQSAAPKKKPKTGSCVFLFTGQGSQYAGMGADLFRDNPSFRETLLSYQELATGVGLPRFIDLISDPGLDISVQSTTKIQLAIVALEIALARTMKTWGITPDVVIGHSLGEYAALCVAGVLSVSDALLLVGSRAALMERHLIANAYAMLATGTTEESVRERFTKLKLESCSIACVNAPSVTVASGTLQDIEVLQKHMAAEGARSTLLRVPYGFHSGQVEPILEGIQHLAKGVVFSKPTIPIVSTLTGKVEREASAFSPAYLARQAREKVNYVEALKACQAAGLSSENSLWVEIGPDPVSVGLARRTLDIPAAQLLPTLKSGENNWRTISNAVRRVYESGASINWPEFHKHFKNSLTLLNLPSYAFDSRDFWTPYKESEVPSISAPGAVSSKSTVAAPSTVATTPRASLTGNTPGFPTHSLQQVDDENIKGQTITTTFSSRISDSHLLEAIQGHAVNGQTICPLGIFQDMALTASKHAFHRMHANAKLPEMSIRNIDMSHALVVTAATLDVLLCVTSSYNTEDKIVDIQFHSKKGDTISPHGTCQVTFGENPTWKSSLSQTIFLVNSRMEALRDQANVGKAHRLLKPVVYQLFSSAVSYSSTYQALEEVVMDTKCTDAIGTVKLPDVSGLGQFHANPYWTDAVVHLAGFILNSSLRYPQDITCLAVGFDTWRSTTDLIPGETYTTYVCMQDVPKKQMVSGDCYVFRGEELVQAFLGIKFLRLKKIALNSILGIAQAPAPQVLPAPIQPVTPRKASVGNGDMFEAKKVHIQLPQRDETPKSLEPSSAIETQSPVAAGFDSAETFKSLLSIVATESGCSLDDMTDDASYADLGVDSVMAITIFTMVNRAIGLDLPAAFFMDNETIGESKKALLEILDAEGQTEPLEETDGDMKDLQPDFNDQPKLSLPPSPPSYLGTPASSLSSRSPSPGGETDRTPMVPPIVLDVVKPKKSAVKVIPPQTQQKQPTVVSKVTHYQGPRTPDSEKLFFLADESGSAFGYIQLPSLGPNLGVYGVESPFARNPAGLDLSVQELAQIYQAAIQKEQPSGPYMLGGVSAGAMLAFEVARGLLEAGQEVRGLLILDCVSPKLDTPTNNGSGVKSVGRFMKPSQVEHIKNTVSLFAAYRPAPLTSLQRPKVTLQVLAKNKLRSDPSQPDTLQWAEIIPGLQTSEVGIESGSFLALPVVNVLGQVCKNAVQSMRS